MSVYTSHITRFNSMTDYIVFSSLTGHTVFNSLTGQLHLTH